MSSGSPSSQLANDGEASRLLRLIASLSRSFGRDRTIPGRRRRSCRTAAAGCCWISCGRSRSLPARHDVVEHVREKNVLAAADRIGVDAQQREQARRRRGDPFAESVGIVDELRRRGVERLQHGDRDAGAGAGRVDHALDRVAEAADAVRAFVPLGQAVCATARPGWRRSRRATSACGPLRFRRSTAGSRSARGWETRAAGCRGRPWGRSRSRGCRRARLLPSSDRHSPVLPLPVMPTQTACVVRSLLS